jgi:GNAT superfamily N-acetyltransferase
MPTTTLTLRLATVDDIDELVRLRRVMMDALAVPDEPTWAGRCAAFLRDGFADGTATAAVADAPGTAGRLVACGIGTIIRRPPGPDTPNGLYGYIASMVTEPGWRSRGLATGIVSELLAWFTARDVRKVDLHASAEGEPIYRRFGFTDAEFPELRWRAPAAS